MKLVKVKKTPSIHEVEFTLVLAEPEGPWRANLLPLSLF